MSLSAPTSRVGSPAFPTVAAAPLPPALVVVPMTIAHAVSEAGTPLAPNAKPPTLLTSSALMTPPSDVGPLPLVGVDDVLSLSAAPPLICMPLAPSGVAGAGTPLAPQACTRTVLAGAVHFHYAPVATRVVNCDMVP